MVYNRDAGIKEALSDSNAFKFLPAKGGL